MQTVATTTTDAIEIVPSNFAFPLIYIMQRWFPFRAQESTGQLAYDVTYGEPNFYMRCALKTSRGV